MVKDSRFGIMAKNTKGNGLKIICVDKVWWNGQMDVFMLVFSIKMPQTGMECLNGQVKFQI
jgi:hypothetical protein